MHIQVPAGDPRLKPSAPDGVAPSPDKAFVGWAKVEASVDKTGTVEKTGKAWNKFTLRLRPEAPEYASFAVFGDTYYPDPSVDKPDSNAFAGFFRTVAACTGQPFEQVKAVGWGGDPASFINARVRILYLPKDDSRKYYHVGFLMNDAEMQEEARKLAAAAGGGGQAAGAAGGAAPGQQTGGYAPQGAPQPGYAPQQGAPGYAPQGAPGYAPQQGAPQPGYPQPGYAPQQGAPGYAPQQGAPQPGYPTGAPGYVPPNGAGGYPG